MAAISRARNGLFTAAARESRLAVAHAQLAVSVVGALSRTSLHGAIVSEIARIASTHSVLTDSVTVAVALARSSPLIVNGHQRL